MRISDWSSDVCSSDLVDQRLRIGTLVLARSYPRIAILTADIHKPVGRERQADIALKQIIFAIILIILPVASDEGRSFAVVAQTKIEQTGDRIGPVIRQRTVAKSRKRVVQGNSVAGGVKSECGRVR